MNNVTTEQLEPYLLRVGSMTPRTSASTASSGDFKRIIIVVPGRLFRDGIQRVLQRVERVVAGSYESINEINFYADDFVIPDLFIVALDASQNLVALFDRIKDLRARMPVAKWILLSREAGPDLIRAAIQIGVDDLLLQDSPGEVLQSLTELVLRGHSLILSNLSRMILEDDRSAPQSLNKGLQSCPDALPTERPDGGRSVDCNLSEQPLSDSALASLEGTAPLDQQRAGASGSFSRGRQTKLSDRENDILKLLVEGQSNKSIAKALQIAEATVKVHVKTVLRKMQVRNRTQAAIAALSFTTVPVFVPDPVIRLLSSPAANEAASREMIGGVEVVTDVANLAAD